MTKRKKAHASRARSVHRSFLALFVSIVFEAKSSEKTTVEIWAEARGDPNTPRRMSDTATTGKDLVTGCK